ncbi:MAG: hypothetical protein EBZ48_05130 [Proteobacteria bacterium]|nr:hypothetical protein [Pseudomonadota bacterium]
MSQSESHNLLGTPNSSTVEVPRGRRGCFKGCLLSLLVATVLVGAGSYLAISYTGAFVRWGTATILDLVSQKLLTQLPLSSEQRASIEQSLQRLSADVRSGKITISQAYARASQLASGSVGPLVINSSLYETLLKNSGLSAAEKSAGAETMKRFLSGTLQSQFSKEDTDAILKHLQGYSRLKDQLHTQLPQQLSDAEIRTLLTRMRTAVESAGSTSASRAAERSVWREGSSIDSKQH